MQTRTSLLAKSTSLLGAAVALLFASQSVAQVSYSENFDVAATGWTGNFLRFTGTTTCGGTGGAMRRNIFGTGAASTGQLISPLTGNSVGGNCTITFDYKVQIWSANTVAAPAPWGTIDVQYGATATGPWTTFATITNEAQVNNTCLNKSFPFNPPAGPLFIRWNCTRLPPVAPNTGDNWWNVDNVSITEVPVPCTTPAPGNTVGPAEACPGANFTLSLQNSTPGVVVSYQWFSSTVSASGPWTPVGTNAPTFVTNQTVASWYYCDVTCDQGPVTTSSNVLAVPMSVATLPQDWSTGVVNPNCWSTVLIAGTGLPLYNLASGFAVGTGSVQFNGWSQAATTENALVSPVLPASPGGQFVIFDAAGDFFASSVDQLFVEQSNDGGTTWTNVASLTNAQVGGVLNTRNVGTNYTTPLASEWRKLGFPIAAGTDRLRFRWDSAFGNNIYIDNVTLDTSAPASHVTIGAGCYSVDNPSTLAELFASASAAKAALDGNSLDFINTGNGYLALWNVGGGANYVAPTAPTVRAVGDEGTVTFTPSLITPSPSGPVTQWTIHANGALTAGATSNPAGFTSTLAALGTAANLGFWSFHDFNETTAGQVVTEEVGSMLYVTWDAVGGFGQPTDLSTFQFQVNMATGDVSIVWVSMHSVDLELNFVGATLAGVEPTPASSVLSTVTPFSLSNDQLPMTLSVVGAPINGGPAPTYTVSNLPEFFPGAGVSTLAIVFGFTVFPGGIDLGPGPLDIGAPGCNGYTTPDVLVIIGVVPFAPVSFPIAWNIPVAPGTLYMQAASQFSPNTLPNGQNAGGIIVSNALEINISNF